MFIHMTTMAIVDDEAEEMVRAISEDCRQPIHRCTLREGADGRATGHRDARDEAWQAANMRRKCRRTTMTEDMRDK